MENQSVISNFIRSAILSIVIFYTFNPLFIIYFSVVFLSGSLFFINFSPKKSPITYLNLIAIASSNLITLAVIKHLIHGTLHKNGINIFLCCILIITYVAIAKVSICTLKKPEKIQTHDKKLLPMRESDLERILQYLEKVNSIGVNGTWGSGKTFLVNKLKEKLEYSNQYEFIELDLLSSNLDEIEFLILNEMEKILSKYKVFPVYSSKLKRFLRDTPFYDIISTILFSEDATYSITLNNFIDEVNKINKTIVIVYEDIDRISNKDVIKKILSISEKLTKKNIKVIYQYDQNNLNKLNLERNYLEKYISYTINITPIPFEVMLNYLLRSKSKLQYADFRFFNHRISVDEYLKKELGHPFIDISFNNIPIRKIEQFLEEIEILFDKKNEYYENEKHRQFFITFQFLKHFMDEYYEMLSLDKGLLDTLTFEYAGKHYTLPEIVHNRELFKRTEGKKGTSIDDFNEIFNIEKNEMKLFIISLFGYTLNNIDQIDEDIPNSIEDFPNEKKDRLLWNLLAAGKSEYTDYEITANKLINEVLSLPPEEQIEAYRIFDNDLYAGNFKKMDNSTIFMMGIPQFPTLAKALRANAAKSDEWHKFIEFYLNYTNKKVIDFEFIQILNYISLTSRKHYLKVLKKFNNLEIIGNFNQHEIYYIFLKKFLNTLSQLGIFNSHTLKILISNENNVALSHGILDELIDELKKYSENISLTYVATDLNIIIEFINKNQKIINHVETISTKTPGVSSGFRSNYPNQNEFDRLKIVKQDDSHNFKTELKSSYDAEKITIYEVNKLFNDKN